MIMQLIQLFHPLTWSISTDSIRNRIPNAGLLVLAWLATLAGSTAIAAETWTDNTGKYQVVGDFLALRDNVVYLRKENGVTIAVPMERLNVASQQLARRLATAPHPAPGAVPPVPPAAPATAPPATTPAADTTPDAEISALMGRLQSGDFGALWDSLPPTYQADINEVVRTFGQNMDADIWNAGKRVVDKAVSVLRDKKQFILGYPALQQPAMNVAAVDKNWDLVVGLLDAIVRSELTDLNKLKEFDGASFLSGSGKEIGDRLGALSEAFQADVDPNTLPVPMEFPGMEVVPTIDFASVKISTVQVHGDTAVLRFEQPDGKTEDHQAVRVEGKWLPKEMVDGWQEGIEQSKLYLTTTMPGQLKEAKPMLLSPFSPMKMVEGVLDQLLAADDQQAFNEVIDGITEMVGGMMGFGEDDQEVEDGMAPFGQAAGDQQADSFDDPFAPPPGGGNP
jgi:hypothetical protein